MNYDLIIIGGGPAGMMSAIEAAKKNIKICILEHNDRLGKKILSTGNGKCNITNMNMQPFWYNSNSDSNYYDVIEAFGPEKLRNFFQSIGVLTKQKNDYVYPFSEQASTVLDALRNKLDELKITVFCGIHIEKITSSDKNFIIKTSDNTFHTKKIILSCGSKCAKKTGSDGSGYEFAKAFGHNIVPVIPALCQLKCSENFYKELHGVRCDAKLTILSDRKDLICERGELQLTDYGISGIPVFQLSRHILRLIEYKMHPRVNIDFMPDYDLEKLKKIISDICLNNPKLDAVSVINSILNKKLANVILKECNIKPGILCSKLFEADILRICKKIKGFICTPVSSNGFDNAQTCAGGVNVDEININTMESKIVSGLYFAGEILDVDGICGGYNLQWAFSSGKLAGESVGKALINDKNKSN